MTWSVYFYECMRAGIDQIQEEIVSEYAVLAEDLELTLHYLMDEGKKLPALSAEEQKELDNDLKCLLLRVYAS